MFDSFMSYLQNKNMYLSIRQYLHIEPGIRLIEMIERTFIYIQIWDLQCFFITCIERSQLLLTVL